jgi:hypothetical protein
MDIIRDETDQVCYPAAYRRLHLICRWLMDMTGQKRGNPKSSISFSIMDEDPLGSVSFDTNTECCTVTFQIPAVRSYEGLTGGGGDIGSWPRKHF